MELQELVDRIQRWKARVAAEEAGEAEAPPAVSQFDWPMHNNSQLDRGEEASRAAVAGFVGRKLEQYSCRGVVLMGEGCPLRVDLGMLPQLHCVRTPGTLAMLSDPKLKQLAWTALRQLLQRV